MKALMVVVASLFFSSPIKAHGGRCSELTDSFFDQVKSVTQENKTLIVRFLRQTNPFNIQTDHPQYADIKAKLELAQKIDQKIKVIAIIPSMTIKEII